MFIQDISLYSKLDFIPLYSVGGIQMIAVYQFRREIIEYTSQKYKYYKFIYYPKKDIQRLLYESVYQEYSEGYSAKKIKLSLLVVILLIILLLLIVSRPVFFLILNLCYFLHTLFKLFVTVISFWKKDKDFDLPKYDLPIYTILVPIKNEKRITIKKLMNSLAQLDYCQSKLDVKLVVEESDVELVETIDTRFDIIKVPSSFPQTKAKACNYALNFAKGEYVTIYDADDKPDVLQLKKVLSIFKNDNRLVCVQAPLNYYNYNYNYLTKFFALEYSSAFDFILPGLNKLGLPILLGGSSNHFRINVLRDCGGWDPYNVTEDADLGIKLFRKRYKVHVLQNYETLEESPITINSWVKQRARWIKGHIITYLVHMRKPKKLITDIGITSFVFLQLFMLIPVIIYIFLRYFC